MRRRSNQTTYDDEFFKNEILKLFSRKERTRSEIYKALGTKLRAAQLNRILDCLEKENKISHRVLQSRQYPKCYRLRDHPNQVKDRKSKEEYQQMWNDQVEKARASRRAEEARIEWQNFFGLVMADNEPEDVFELLCRVLSRAGGKTRRWVNSVPC